MNLTVSSSPHIRSNDTTKGQMLHVLIALLPALIVGVFVFTVRALLVTIASIAGAMIGEALFRAVTKRHQTLFDLSAVVTGLLLAMTLPVTVPYYIPLIGGLFATIVVKGICGGLGKNSFNPALGARAFLLMLFPVWMIRYTAPFGMLPLGNLRAADIITTATPMHSMQMPALPDYTLTDMFLGRIPGTIGEVSAIALIIGGVYLVWKKVISLRIPAAYLGTLAVLTFVFYKGEDPLKWMLYALFGGGVMLGAIFMATDYASSPVNPLAQTVYGIGCGILTVIFRYKGLYPEGVTYAILIMNGASYLLDMKLPRRIYGTGDPAREGTAKRLAPLAACFVVIALIGAVVNTAETKTDDLSGKSEIFSWLMPGETYAEEAYDGEDENVRAVYKSENGYVVEVTTAGYADDITLLVGVNNDGTVNGVVATDLSETYGLGARASSDAGFLSQFLGTKGEAEVGRDIDALTGATVTSKAVTRAVNSAVAVVTGADVASGATEWE